MEAVACFGQFFWKGRGKELWIAGQLVLLVRAAVARALGFWVGDLSGYLFWPIITLGITGFTT